MSCSTDTLAPRAAGSRRDFDPPLAASRSAGGARACRARAATATYVSARDEVDDLLDEELRQVALSLRDHAVLDLRRLESVAANPAQRVLVQIWDPAFDRPYVSRVVGTGPMPRTDEGFATVLHDTRPWRVSRFSPAGS